MQKRPWGRCLLSTSLLLIAAIRLFRRYEQIDAAKRRHLFEVEAFVLLQLPPPLGSGRSLWSKIGQSAQTLSGEADLLSSLTGRIEAQSNKCHSLLVWKQPMVLKHAH